MKYGLIKINPYDIIKTQQRKGDKKMKTTRGWYIFADGYMAWVNGLSKHEKSVMISKHGMIVEFRPTN